MLEFSTGIQLGLGQGFDIVGPSSEASIPAKSNTTIVGSEGNPPFTWLFSKQNLLSHASDWTERHRSVVASQIGGGEGCRQIPTGCIRLVSREQNIAGLGSMATPWMLLLLMESKFPTHLAEKVTRGTASPASALSPSPQMVRQGSVGFGLGSHLFPRIFGYFFWICSIFLVSLGILWGSLDISGASYEHRKAIFFSVHGLAAQERHGGKKQAGEWWWM